MANIRLPEHSHCEYCGDPIPFGERYCDGECRQNDVKKKAQEKRKEYIFYGIAAATILILFAIRALTK